MTSRLTRHLRFAAPHAVAAPIAPAPVAPGRAAAPTAGQPAHDPPLAPRDETIFLLHIAAEVEHALLVQYLFAAYSLKDPSDLPADQGALVRAWRDTIVTVAREEMGHLITVQNLLRALGGPLSFARDEFPFHSGFYPFPFKLEAISKDSLAKYAFAEMPAPDIAQSIDGVTPAEINDITARAATDNVGVPVNRVALLYDRLITLVGGLPASDFNQSTIGRQGRFDEWGLGNHDLVIRQVGTRDQAVQALLAVAEQGEGPQTATAAAQDESHFQRFLGVFRAFPGDGPWQPALPVAENPNATEPPDSNASDPERITHPGARLWAQLCNRRYRMLLTDLSHALDLETPVTPGANLTPRGVLLSWAFGEMYHLRSISRILMRLPLTAAAGETRAAGPSFEMPFTLDLPSQEADRWKMHRDLITGTAPLIDGLKALPPDQSDPIFHAYLDGMRSTDAEALQIAVQAIAQ